MLKKVLAIILVFSFFTATVGASSVFNINDKPEGMNSWLNMKDMLDNGRYEEAEKIVRRDDRDAVVKTDYVRVDVDDTTSLWETSEEQFGFGTEAAGYLEFITDGLSNNISDEWRELVDKIYESPTVRYGGGRSNSYNLWNDVQHFYNRTFNTNVLSDDDLYRYHGDLEKARATVTRIEFVDVMSVVDYIKGFELIRDDIGFIFCLSMTHATPEDNMKFIRFCLDDPEESTYGKMRKELLHEEPVKIVAIEMGNEIYFRSAAHEFELLEDMRSWYTETFIENATLINKYHPEVMISPCLICTDDKQHPGLHKEWNEYIIEHCGKYMFENYPEGNRLLSLHNYYGGTSLANSYKRVELTRESCKKFFGENHGFKGLVSEHSKWATNYPPALTMFSALSTVQYLNRAFQWEDNFIWGSQYYGFYSHNLWAIVRTGTDGIMEPTAINDAYDMYMDNYGDRVMGSWVETLDDSGIGDIYDGRYRYSNCVFATGDDEIKIIMANGTADQDVDVTFNFKSGNRYRLVKEEKLTGYNLYSFRFNQATNDVIWRESCERNEENFNHYLMPAYSMVVLTLKSDIKLPDVGEQIDFGKWIGEDYYNDISGESLRGQINFLTASGILSGNGNGTFKPDSNVTRAEFAAMLCRIANLDTEADSLGFDDVASDAWYNGVVEAVVKAGYMRGTSASTFSPEDDITLTEGITALYRVVSSKETVEFAENADELVRKAGFECKPEDWETEGLRFAVSYDIINGLGTIVVSEGNKVLNRSESAGLIFAVYGILR